jgi:Rrf2 family protein
MISKKTKYALKALIYLAGQPSGNPVLIADLARNENIPKKFLEFILLSLRKGGLLQSKVGKGGLLSLPASFKNQYRNGCADFPFASASPSAGELCALQ